MESMEEMMKMMQKKEGLKKLNEELCERVLPEGEGRRMHAMAVRWTLLETIPYALSIVGHDNPEVMREVADLVRKISDLCVDNMSIEKIYRVPGPTYFQTLCALKEADDV